MASGFLNLAYMAELGVVVSLAYRELESLRYVEDARSNIDRHVIPGLELCKCNGTAGGNNSDVFIELYTQVKNLFVAQSDMRHGSWYKVIAGNQRCYYKYSSKWLFPLFMNAGDRRFASWSMVCSSAIIVLMTLLTKTMDASFSEEILGAVTWWVFFGLLAASMGGLAILVLAGRRVRNVLTEMTQDILERKQVLGTEMLDAIRKS
jgi:hypothetical protein